MTDPLQRGSWSDFAVEPLLVDGACPLCEAERQAAIGSLDAILYESVTDPGVRERLRAGRGWCGFHFQLAMQLARKAGRVPSVALLYGDVLSAAVRSDWRRPAWCDVCRLSVLAAVRAAEQLADVLGRGALDEAFERAGPTCLTHVPVVVALPASRGRDCLLQPALDALGALAGDLADYARRQAYDYQGDKGDRGAMRRLEAAVRGTWAGTTANQGRAANRPRPWYRRLLG